VFGHCWQGVRHVLLRGHKLSHAICVNTKTSGVLGRGAGWRSGRTLPPLATAVAALVIMTLCGHLAAPTARASEHLTRVNELIVRYEIGVPAAALNGRPWGAQCVRLKDQKLLQRGRWIGAGMRRIDLNKPVSRIRADRIAREMSQCPYVLWAESNGLTLGPAKTS
jgi:hypothetical protein